MFTKSVFLSIYQTSTMNERERDEKQFASVAISGPYLL